MDELSCSKWRHVILLHRILAKYYPLSPVSEEETIEMSDMDHSASEDQKELDEKPKKKKRRRREIDMVSNPYLIRFRTVLGVKHRFRTHNYI